MQISCTSSIPELTGGVVAKYGYNYNPSLGSVSRSISLFTEVIDEDGVDDIEKLQISSDLDDIYWELNKDNWSFIKVDDESAFIGSNDIFIYDNFDGGTYSISIIDYSGKKSTQKVILNNIDVATVGDLKKQMVIPDVNIQKNVVTIVNYNQIKKGNVNVFILAYNGKVMDLSVANSYQMELNPQNHNSVYIYLANTTTGVFYRAGPYFPPA